MAINSRMQAIIDAAAARTKKLLEEGPANITAALPTSVTLAADQSKSHDHLRSKEITINGNTFNPYYIDGVGELNAEQSEAVLVFGILGQSGCLIGAAGTGKTTTMKAVVNAAIRSGRIPTIQHCEHKYLDNGHPGIWGGSFTRIATRNLRDNVPPDIKPNIHTIHRLLEFEPTFVSVVDKVTGKEKNIRIFIPTRTKYRPLPSTITCFCIDEASMVGTNLHAKFQDAIGAINAQVLYIGDIAQLPPVMDDSIFGYKLLELKTVELKHVYRHAGVIVNLANHIRTGNTIPSNTVVAPYSTNLRRLPRAKVEQAISEWNKEEDGSKVTIHLWKNRLEGEVGQLRALQNLGHVDLPKKALGFFPREIMEGNYDPLTDMILMPYNKGVGTIELNKYISDFLGKIREAEVHEVIAGFQKHYFAEGDKVFFEREEALITKINNNAMYVGKIPQKASKDLDRWGHTQNKLQTDARIEMDSIDELLHISVNPEEDEERKNASSHVIYVKKISEIKEDGVENAEEHRIDSAAEVNNLLFGYALTIHKSQGSQWRKVYCVFHNSHNRNLQRELLYTAITRAQKELYVICEPETFIQGVLSQHIQGNTLAEKAEYFKGKINEKLANDNSLIKEPQ